MADRRSLHRHFDRMLSSLERDRSAQSMDRFAQEAFDFVTGPTARDAFNIDSEEPRRDRYGRHN
ncbi:MAG: hypothetical protein U0793_06180 [Gemmataceae bacterium]